jgi:transposase InsO family protein
MEHTVRAMCRVYGVTASGYYAWRRRRVSRRRFGAAVLLNEIRRVHRSSGQTYGSPRIAAVLRAQGYRCGRHRVARLMRQHGIRARIMRVYRRAPGVHEFFEGIQNARLKMIPIRMNQIWVADLTYLRVGRRYWYLAAVMDLYSRRIVGWALGAQRNVDLTRRALRRALQRRGAPRGLIFHTDRGSEYGAYRYRRVLERYGVVQSMNRPRHAEDNNHMESFFHTLKADVIHGHTFDAPPQLHGALRRYIDGFYNRRRLHSSLGYRSPVDYEKPRA